MFSRRSRFLSFPLVIGAVMGYTKFISMREERDNAEMENNREGIPQEHEPTSVGVVSGKAIFGQPLDEYWKKKLQEEAATAAAAKETNENSSSE
ncbi:unnamed protein product [Linum tenue]|uniref:Uncharacterized protein n=1 Tax=Linum tenue TaxID=586396 RepID=A0AAV0LB11_9ROSI|nr:unnamed protein product [Linum tenue]